MAVHNVWKTTEVLKTNYQRTVSQNIHIHITYNIRQHDQKVYPNKKLGCRAMIIIHFSLNLLS